MSSGVYQILNLITGDDYVGSAVDLKKRARRHWRRLVRGTHVNQHLQNAFNKYGAAAFRFEVLEICESAQCEIYEQFYLDKLQPAYNICRTAGSSLGRPVNEETRARIGAAHKGKKYTKETRAY